MRKFCLVIGACFLATFCSGFALCQEIGDSVKDRISGQSGEVVGFTGLQNMVLVRLDGSGEISAISVNNNRNAPSDRTLEPKIEPGNLVRGWARMEDGTFELLEGRVLASDGDIVQMLTANGQLLSVPEVFISRSTKNREFEEYTHRAWLIAHFSAPRFAPFSPNDSRGPIARFPLDRPGYWVVEFSNSGLALAGVDQNSGEMQNIFYLGSPHARARSLRIFGDLLVVDYHNSDLAGFSLDRMLGLRNDQTPWLVRRSDVHVGANCAVRALP